ncbi:hypothetical protein K7432_009889 [Basidiobolus ranarum]|uniref:Uncharacterized protein n=1 Tax=Basidiobolus ranarum TaxID=34480 RepID=A0ABR2VWU1_9FUNG
MDQLRVNILASTGYIQESFATLFVNEKVGIIYPLAKITTPAVQTHEKRDPITVAGLPKVATV